MGQIPKVANPRKYDTLRLILCNKKLIHLNAKIKMRRGLPDVPITLLQLVYIPGAPKKYFGCDNSFAACVIFPKARATVRAPSYAAERLIADKRRRRKRPVIKLPPAQDTGINENLIPDCLFSY